MNGLAAKRAEGPREHVRGGEKLHERKEYITTLSRRCLSVGYSYRLAQRDETREPHNISSRRFGAPHEDRNRTLTGGEAYTDHVQATRAQRTVREPNEGGHMKSVFGSSG